VRESENRIAHIACFVFISLKKVTLSIAFSFCLFVRFIDLCSSNHRQQYIPYNARGGGGDARRGRGGFQGSPGGMTHRDAGGDNKDGQMPQRVPPPTYVCYRCGQKGITRENTSCIPVFC
jgi:hypothetical protein